MTELEHQLLELIDDMSSAFRKLAPPAIQALMATDEGRAFLDTVSKARMSAEIVRAADADDEDENEGEDEDEDDSRESHAYENR
jgi:hypothetical protein